MKRFLLTLCAALTLTTGIALANDPNYVIDSPTTEILDYGGYGLNFRLFSGGGVLTRLDFGVFKTVNMGFGWELKKVIGTEDVRVSPPKLALKIRVYEGSDTLPAMVLGYDGQGYFYNPDTDEFAQKERGVYFAMGREMWAPNFIMTFGGNISDFKENIVSAFVNASLELDKKIVFFTEYDNIHTITENRLNAGLRLNVNDSLNVDLAGRDIGAAGRKAERVVRVNYLGKF